MLKGKTKTKDLHIRITEKDAATIKKKAEEAGLTLTDYVTKCCLGKQICIIEGLDEVLRQQKYLGNNLNQITRLANSGKATVINLRETQDGFDKITEQINDILERRRWH